MSLAQSSRPARLVVLISGRGRNLQAIDQAIQAGSLHAEITLVVSNKARAAGLQYARSRGLPVASLIARHFADRDQYDAALARRIQAEQPDWVVLAGFMRILGEAFVARFPGRIVNIHPALLPAHKGLHTHERVLTAGDREHGASVHFVTATLDDGPIIRQGKIAVEADDTPDSLADRVMQKVERFVYPAALDDLISGRVSWQEDGIYRDGKRQTQPLVDNRQ